MPKNLKSQCENVYSSRQIESLGWFEEMPGSSLQLIKKCNLSKNAQILNVGAGATTLVDHLLEEGFTNLIASDLSKEAMAKLKSRLGKSSSSKVRWIIDDLTDPKELLHVDPLDLWHDRAVLHFFTEESEQIAYFNLIQNKVKPGGYVIIAVFNLNAATKCSGLPVHRYDQHMLHDQLGSDFTLQETFDYDYVMPSGDSRSYIYTLFRRSFE